MTHSEWVKIAYRVKHNLSCYALAATTIVLLAVFIYMPVIWAFTKSLYQFEVGGQSQYVGLANYTEFLFRDPAVPPSFFNMAVLTFAAICARLSVPLVLAKLIHSLRSERSRHVYRMVFLVPLVVPSVAVQLIWTDLIFAEHGIINQLLTTVGLERWATGWLSNPQTALIACALVGFPFVGGFEVLIYYAGLSAIPESVNEAAELEGCVGIRKFLSIDIPMVMSQLRLILVLTAIAGVQGYQNLFILTRGGPGFRTMVPGLWMYYNGFSFQRMGYACAIGVCLFFIIFSLTFINLRYFRSTERLKESP